ncbi:hypothetical protein NPIL_329091 [Nephila pilipes]|uniref:Uncharacterized protein n=1 Tax=Nephila pilipes TaxID=299642 RepID=A0A8X6UG92_NEPPI|nr:hypothetical protein NPIL_329091 [Nephila pilipes]
MPSRAHCCAINTPPQYAQGFRRRPRTESCCGKTPAMKTTDRRMPAPAATVRPVRTMFTAVQIAGRSKARLGVGKRVTGTAMFCSPPTAPFQYQICRAPAPSLSLHTDDGNMRYEQ